MLHFSRRYLTHNVRIARGYLPTDGTYFSIVMIPGDNQSMVAFHIDSN